MLGLAPAAPLLAKLPSPAAPVARAADILTYPTAGWFTRETSAWTVSAVGVYQKTMTREQLKALTA